MFWTLLIMYLVFISLISLIITAVDKINSLRKKGRVSESLLLFVGFIGGALMMYITMNCINHKTRKNKFMITLPLMFIGHIILVMSLYIYF